MIIPANEHYKKVVWVMDFVFRIRGLSIPVEVKGGWVNARADLSKDWQRKLHLFSHFQPELFDRLIVFTDYQSESQPFTVVRNFQDLRLAIKEQIECL